MGIPCTRSFTVFAVKKIIKLTEIQKTTHTNVWTLYGNENLGGNVLNFPVKMSYTSFLFYFQINNVLFFN